MLSKHNALIAYLYSLFVTICIAVRYDNYKLFSGIPSQDSHLLFLRSLKDMGLDVNFWTEPGLLGKPVEFSIAPGNETFLLQEANKLSIPITLLHDDIQKLFNQEIPRDYVRTGKIPFTWQFYFYAAHDINGWLKKLADVRAPEIVIHTIGRTYEKKEILAAVIVLKGSLRRSKVVIEGGIHAREWIAPTFVTYMIDKILNAPHSDDEELKKIAMTYEWYFIPILNPDGYDYSHKLDRMWRKNRNGLGIDLNRNFGHNFGVYSGVDPAEENWPGPKAFSENESTALANYVKFIGEGIEYYIAFHSYGQYMIIPYSSMTEHLDNYHEVKNMASRAADAIKKVNRKVYNYGNALETVGYMHGGGSACWIKHHFKVPYVLTFELADKSQYGFALPTDLIMPTCIETLAGVLNFLSPQNNTFAQIKNKYTMQKSVEKYKLPVNSRCVRVILLKTVMFFNVFCIKLF